MPDRDLLAKYNAKRDFARTPEPKGVRTKATGQRFIVQKHEARRLHWDFRLEVDGVLKSWAVTRGPSLDPKDKRLAVRTEDHPLDYATFEGTIPAGEYGGGTVMLWDRGTWEPAAGKSAADLDDGHLHFTLHGERLHGAWLLVRMKPRPGEKRENWLLRKIDDEYAELDDRLTEKALTSVTSGRTMAEIASGGAPRKTRNARKAAIPDFVPPQLAMLTDTVPQGNSWLHEPKYDGYRALLSVGGGKAKVFTRNGLDWTDRFGAIVRAAVRLPVSDALLDGEIVVFDSEGRTDFGALQQAIHGKSQTPYYIAFDLLQLDGDDLRSLPTTSRKSRLEALLDESPLMYSPHIVGAGEKLFAAMCKARHEGIVSKKCGAPYISRRTTAWRKIKCIQRQEFVVIGWTESSARPGGIKSLLLGVYEDGQLRYAGKVGTGFDARTRDALMPRLAALEQPKPATPVTAAADKRGAKWTSPTMVVEVAFAEFTSEGRVRHASFIGFRDDKPATEVVRETPEPGGETNVRITNPDRVIFPEAGITKGELAAYYEGVAGVMLPWAAFRPISLVRCPQGRAHDCFFQKHDAGSFGEAVKHVDIREKDGTVEPYLYIEDAPGLLTCVQMGTIEFHGWGSRVDDVELPDRLVFDLDPDPAVSFAEVKDAARHLRDELEALGLVSFAMLTGGKGVHVVVPLTPAAHWDTAKDFCRRFSMALVQASPDRYTAQMSKAKRKGRIFIDWLRNQRGATAILPYSARARPNAPVAAPITWRELDDVDAATIYDIKQLDLLKQRAASKALAGWGAASQALPDL